MNKKAIWIIVILVLVVGGLGFVFKENIGLSAFTAGGQYYVPMYTTVVCDELPGKVTGTWDLSDYKKDGNGFLGVDFSARKDVMCGGNELNAWFPEGCDFTIEQLKTGFFEPGLRIMIGECKSVTNQCTHKFDLGDGDTKSVHIDNFDYLSVQFSGAQFLLDEDDVVIKTNSQAYGIWQFVGTGKVDILPTCDLDKLKGMDYKGTFPEVSSTFDGGHVLKAGLTMPIIIGQTAIQSPRMIVNKGGEAVYISGPGGYYPTFTENGKVYVDARPQNFIIDNSIVCTPASPICNDDGTAYTTSSEGKFCDKFVGIGSGYVQKDTGTACIMECNEDANKLEFTNECIDIQQSCPSEKPFFNSVTGECIAVGPGGDAEGEDSFLMWVIIIGAAVIIITLLSLLMGRKKPGF